jgi:hypothetical protein
MNKFNPALADIALSMFSQLNLEKNAFVPMDPASMQQQQQPQQAPQGDPAAQGGAPADPAAGGAPQGGPPAVTGAGGQGVSLDDVRSTVRQEVEAANEKPKKQSVDERLTALEGAFLRLLQHLGMIEKQETDLDAGLPQDADKMQQEQQGQGGMPGADPMAGGGAPPPDAGGGMPPTGQPSSMDMGGGAAMGGQPKMASLNNPHIGLATALARLRNRV